MVAKGSSNSKLHNSIHWKWQTRLAPMFDADMGKRLSLARMKMGLSQAELGARMGLSQSVMSSLEKGQTKLPDVTLSRFAAALGEATTYVILGSGKEAYEKPGVRIEYWKKRLARSTGDNKSYVNSGENVREDGDKD